MVPAWSGVLQKVFQSSSRTAVRWPRLLLKFRNEKAAYLQPTGKNEMPVCNPPVCMVIDGRLCRPDSDGLAWDLL